MKFSGMSKLESEQCEELPVGMIAFGFEVGEIRSRQCNVG